MLPSSNDLFGHLINMTLSKIKLKILCCKNNFIPVLLLTSALTQAIEVATTISSSPDGTILAAVILVLTFLSLICYFIGLAAPSASTGRFYSVSVILSLSTLSSAVFYDLFLTSNDEDRVFLALVGLSVEPLALLTINDCSKWGLLTQYFGAGIAFATQLACIIVTDASSYNLWLSWLLYLCFLFIAYVHSVSSSDGSIDKDNRHNGLPVHGGVRVSPEPSSSSLSPSSAAFDMDIAKVNEDNRIIRQLIGNVAHDLKTPLSSFMVGLELVQDWIHDLQHLCKHSSAEVLNLLTRIETSLHDAQITDIFMISTINRCIEYTKSTSDIKLIPKDDSVIVNDAINFALLCMNHSNTQFTFKLLPMDADKPIASHIFTDQQWLQENLLCLLSNAAKYSHTGEITVRIYLQPRSSLQKNSDIYPSRHLDVDEEADENTDGQVGCHPPSIQLPSTLAKRHFSAISRHNNNLILEDLVVEVEDHGIGVSEDKKPFLFGAFGQAQKMAGGTGLGLYSMAKRVQALNGSFGLRSRRDGERGSCFWFAIPYHPNDMAVLDCDEGQDDETGNMNHTDSSSRSIDRPTERNGVPLLQRRASFATSFPRVIKQQVISEQPLSAEVATEGDAKVAGVTRPASLAPSFPYPILNTQSNEETTARTLVATSQSRHYHHEKKKRILLADDSASIVKVTEKVLQRHGYAVDIAVNGFVAVQFIEKCFSQRDINYYEVVLMDLQMPVMDGLEAVKRMREIELGSALSSLRDYKEKAKPLLIVGLSANSDDETLSTVANAGFDGFLTKPFRMNDFNHLMLQMKRVIDDTT